MYQHETNFGFTNVLRNIDSCGDMGLRNRQFQNRTPCKRAYICPPKATTGFFILYIISTSDFSHLGENENFSLHFLLSTANLSCFSICQQLWKNQFFYSGKEPVDSSSPPLDLFGVEPFLFSFAMSWKNVPQCAAEGVDPGQKMPTSETCVFVSGHAWGSTLISTILCAVLEAS